MKHAKFLKNVAFLSAGGLVAKAIGALYRIPLAGVLGSYGTGLYQMAYPFFCVLLTFSSAGIPTAFSRIVAKETARGEESADTLKAALKMFALLGLAGTLIMALLAPYVGALQGQSDLTACYFALAPSVFLVALIAVLRGYFQGKNNMIPTAVSEVVEQTVKAGIGLLAATFFSHDTVRAVVFALSAVTVSEVCALVYLFGQYRAGRGRVRTMRKSMATGAGILYAAIPVMVAASLLPVSQMADSIVIVRLLSRHTARSVALYGLFTGGAVTLVNLPAAVCCGLSAATVPAVSACFARGEEEEGRRKALFSLAVTLALAVPCAIGLFALARPVVRLLYGGLSAEDGEMLVRLIRLSSVSAATLAGVQTLSACLTGMGRAKYAAFSMLVAVVVKFVLQWALIGNPQISIGGAAIASNACYLVAFFLDLFYTMKKAVGRKKAYDNGHRIGNAGRRLNGAGIGSNQEGG